jgi:hypothetical protein
MKRDVPRDHPCDCCDSDAEHDRATDAAQKEAEAYFGLVGLSPAERRAKLEMWEPYVFNQRELDELEKGGE